MLRLSVGIRSGMSDVKLDGLSDRRIRNYRGKGGRRKSHSLCEDGVKYTEFAFSTTVFLGGRVPGPWLRYSTTHERPRSVRLGRRGLSDENSVNLRTSWSDTSF